MFQIKTQLTSIAPFCSVVFGLSLAANVTYWIDSQTIKQQRFSAAILHWLYRVVSLVIKSRFKQERRKVNRNIEMV